MSQRAGTAGGVKHFVEDKKGAVTLSAALGRQVCCYLCHYPCSHVGPWGHSIILSRRDPGSPSLQAPALAQAMRSDLVAQGFIWLSLENLSGQHVHLHFHPLSSLVDRLKPAWIHLSMLNSHLPLEAQVCPESSHFCPIEKLENSEIHFASNKLQKVTLYLLSAANQEPTL